MTYFSRYDADGNIIATGTIPDHLFELQEGNIIAGQHDPAKQYVASGQVCDYTPSEISARANLPPGWIWKMPERQAIDPRTAEQRAADRLAAVRVKRSSAYPSITEFADAMYWAARGDQSKLADYYAALDAVKAAYPKP